MRISLNWLDEFVAFKGLLDLDAIAKALTMAGIEVESCNDLRKSLKDVELFSVLSKELLDDNTWRYKLKNPLRTVTALGPKVDSDSNNLVAAKANFTKQEKSYRIFTYGDIGDFALEDPIVIKKNDLVNHEPVSLLEVKDFDDSYLHLSVTPNRADALSHLGIAREIRAYLKGKERSLKTSVSEMAGPSHERAVVEIENNHDCPRYALRIIEGVKVDESPSWLKLRLALCGIRSVNNVVDVSNYVMLALGQPMHAFDFNKLKKDSARVNISVRKAKKDEKLLALNDLSIELSKQDLVICDSKGPIALAGVIGGKEPSVTESSVDILLEAAYFDPASIRKSARRHQINTESSFRFERGVDPEAVIDALSYAADLINKIAGGRVCREAIDNYRLRMDRKEVLLRLDRARNILGMSKKDLDPEFIRQSFIKLGIETVAKRGEALYFRIPSFRPDLSREIDLIEEAARMIGYDKVDLNLSKYQDFGKNFVDESLLNTTSKLKQHLISRGFLEAINYAFVKGEEQKLFLNQDDHKKVIKLKNPLSNRYNEMRTTLLLALLNNAAYNLKNQETDIRLFESGRVFFKDEKTVLVAPKDLKDDLAKDSYAIEREMLAGIMFYDGEVSSSLKQRSINFFDLKALILEGLSFLGIEVCEPFSKLSFKPLKDCPYFHPGQSSEVVYSSDKGEELSVAFFGKLHPRLTRKMDITPKLWAFEYKLLNVKKLLRQVPKFKVFSRFPSINRDLALLVDESVCINEISGLAAKLSCATDFLRALKVFDVYRGENLPKGKKSVALSFNLGHEKRTLTDADANQFTDEFLNLAKSKLGAVLR